MIPAFPVIPGWDNSEVVMIDAETERLMSNWARWREGGGSVSLAMSAAYSLEGRGRREEVSIPLINGEAVDVEVAVGTLDQPHRDAVIQFWTKLGTVRQKARDCGCSPDTLYRRLDVAHRLIRAALVDRRERGEALREAYLRQRAGACP